MVEKNIANVVVTEYLHISLNKCKYFVICFTFIHSLKITFPPNNVRYLNK